jgi:hypothetical protein
VGGIVAREAQYGARCVDRQQGQNQPGDKPVMLVRSSPVGAAINCLTMDGATNCTPTSAIMLKIATVSAPTYSWHRRRSVQALQVLLVLRHTLLRHPDGPVATTKPAGGIRRDIAGRQQTPAIIGTM